MARDSSTKKKHQMNNMCFKKVGEENEHQLGRNKKNVDITVGELGLIEKALKQEEFRKLLVEYANEVQDPIAKEKYEADIIKLEAERGMKCVFLRPQPGHVVKARKIDVSDEKSVGKNKQSEESKGGDKVFINVCWDPNVAKPESRQAVDGSTGKSGVRWSVPYCQSRPRQETDGKGVPCDVYDVIFHPEAGILASKDPRIKDLLNTTAIDAIEKAFGVKLDRKNLKSPKLKYKGNFRPTVIKEPFGNNLNSSTESNTENETIDTQPKLVVQPPQASDYVEYDDTVNQPEYTLKYKNTHLDLDPAPENIIASSDPCRPTELVVEIYLPEINSAKGVDLDVLERQLTLDCLEPKRYHLELSLPYPVDEEAGAAKFDKSTRMLIVTLPVKPGQPQKPVTRVVSTDSGIGVDMEEKHSYCEPSVLEATLASSEIQVDEKDDDLKEKLLLPNYTCNIYENLMVFKLDVKNVDPESVMKDALIMKDGQEKGVSLSFVNIGSGMVPMKYGFKMAFVFESMDETCWKDNSILQDMEVEVWDNNIIVQLALPRNCKSYKVGTNVDDMKEYPLNHPLRTFKKKMDKLKNTKSKIDGDLDGLKKTAQNHKKFEEEENNFVSSEEEKERHSSGESVDSCYSESTPPESESESHGEESERGNIHAQRNLPPALVKTSSTSDCPQTSKDLLEQKDEAGWQSKEKNQPRGILKRCVRRCFSESHATSQATNDNIAWTNSILEAISDQISDSNSSAASSEDSRILEDVPANKKSVRFNEVVQRQIFRSNSSIMKQKRKNEKKDAKKLRKRNGRENLSVERRASEGDAESLLDAGFKLSSSFEKSILEADANWGYSSSENGSVSPVKSTAFEKFKNAPKEDLVLPKASIQFDDNDSHTDSGVASSYDEHSSNSPTMIKNMDKIPEESSNENTLAESENSKPGKKTKKNKKNKLTRGKTQQQGHFIKDSNSDLIFDLDF